MSHSSASPCNATLWWQILARVVETPTFLQTWYTGRKIKIRAYQNQNNIVGMQCNHVTCQENRQESCEGSETEISITGEWIGGCLVGAVVSTVVSQQEGRGFEPWGPGSFCAEFACSPCVCVGSPTSSHNLVGVWRVVCLLPCDKLMRWVVLGVTPPPPTTRQYQQPLRP